MAMCTRTLSVAEMEVLESCCGIYLSPEQEAAVTSIVKQKKPGNKQPEEQSLPTHLCPKYVCHSVHVPVFFANVQPDLFPIGGEIN